MLTTPELSTPRLLLRRWRSADRAPFAALNADPRVMEHLPRRLGRAASDALVDRIEAVFARDGFGFFALEHRESGALLGFAGINTVALAAPFTPAVEVGWRLAFDAWGHGYATEAARAALDHGFGPAHGLSEVVAFTARANERSRAVMRRLGMTHAPADDFRHPALPVGHALSAHVLYRLRAADHLRRPPTPGPR